MEFAKGFNVSYYILMFLQKVLTPARHREASGEADGQFGDFNAQHFMNCFPKVAKIARKRLFKRLSCIKRLIFNKGMC